MKTNRRDFIANVTKTIAGLAICPNVLANKGEWFQDIQIDRYYNLRYPEGGGFGQPGKDWIIGLVEEFKWHEKCNELDWAFDHFMEYVNGRKFEVTDYFNEKYYDAVGVVRFDDIEVTKEWLKEFYRRHKNDDIREIQLKNLENTNRYRVHIGREPLNIKQEIEKFDKFYNEINVRDVKWYI